MRKSSVIETERLVLRPPTTEDAAAMFDRYASDAEVTRYMGWPRHTSVQDTKAFIGFSLAEWKRWGVGPLVALDRNSGALLGSSGLVMETPDRAATGYVFARDAWGKGYAGEALAAMVSLAPGLGVRRLYAICHPEHHVSRRVLERGGFDFEGILRAHAVFPNLAPGVPADCACYAVAF